MVWCRGAPPRRRDALPRRTHIVILIAGWSMHSLRLGERIRQRPHHFTRSSRMSKRAELSVLRGVRVRSPPKPRRRRSRRSGPVRTSGRHASSASVASAHPYPHARTLPRVVAWRPLCGRHVERAERRVPPLSTRRRSGANRCCWPNRSGGALEPLGTVSEAAAPDPRPLALQHRGQLIPQDSGRPSPRAPAVSTRRVSVGACFG